MLTIFGMITFVLFMNDDNNYKALEMIEKQHD